LTSITIIPGTGTQTVYKVGETAQFLAIGTFNSNPVTEDLTGRVTWGSVDVDVVAINPLGLATAVGCGFATCTTTITATLKDNPTGAVIVGISDLTLNVGNSGSPLPSLAVYTVGAGKGTVSSAPDGVNCTSGSSTGCTGYFVSGKPVTLTASPQGFGGWSSNCTPTGPNTCTVIMDHNETVGAIFN
jgi:List-Bact-rpt repeat protein